jgi:purine-binding chemotaxis protein CheW
VLNLRKKFHMEELALSETSKIIIIDVRGIIMGAIVDAVSDVLRISPSVVEPPPAVLSHIKSEFIRGVAKLATELVILLDMDKLLDAVEQQAVFGTTK